MKIRACPNCVEPGEMWDEEDPYYPGGPVVIGHYHKGGCSVNEQTNRLQPCHWGFESSTPRTKEL